jgi:chromosome segregation ATPase
LSGSPDARRETIRKQRIESEQRRRDELREGYQRLKDTLPSSNQKASKVSLLDRATTHLKYLDTVKNQLEVRLKAAEAEVHRLRSVNEALMLGTAEQRHAAAAAAVAAVQQSHVSPSSF